VEDKRNRSRLRNLVGMSVLTMLLFYVLVPSGVWAQSTAQISGNVTDQSGAVLPGVSVTVSCAEQPKLWKDFLGEGSAHYATRAKVRFLAAFHSAANFDKEN
jgi:hypothetical protein